MLLRIALVACAVLAGGLGWALWRVDRLSEANATLEASVAAHEAAREQLEVSVRVHREHLARERRENAARIERLNQIEALEGGDAPLSDYLRDGAAIVWP